MDDNHLLEHLIQSEINSELHKKVLTCAKYDEKYSSIGDDFKLVVDFPEQWIGSRLFEKDKRIVTVSSRNVMAIRFSKSLKVEKEIQCDYFATSICCLILGDSINNLRILFGSVMGDLIDWEPWKSEKPMQRVGHKGMIFSIASDGPRIFTISDDRTIRMWSSESTQDGPICTAYGHTARPYSICVDSFSQQIFTGGIEQTLFHWKYTEDSIQLVRKTVLSIGVIRQITQTDENQLIVSSHDGDVMRMDTSVSSESTLLEERILNFAFVNNCLIVLNENYELSIWETDEKQKLLLRCDDMKHLYSSDNSMVVWNQNRLIFFDGHHVYRLKLSQNIISATCFNSYAAIKTIDGRIYVYNFNTPSDIRLTKQFRPPNPSMIPSVFTIVGDFLVIGTTHGELYHGRLSDKSEEINQSLTRKESVECFGGKEVTCLEPIPETSCFMTLGKTGVWSTIRISEDTGSVEILNTRNFSASSRMAWPSKFMDLDGEMLIVGFYGTSLIIWNATNNYPLFESYCGGGHRAWSIRRSTQDPFILNFDFIRDSQFFRQKISLDMKRPVVTTAHSSPIVYAAGSKSYLVTVSLDGHLSIGNDKGKPILTMFVGDNLLSTDIFEDEESGITYVTAGGGKSKLSVWKFSQDDLKNHTFTLRHINRPDEGRIVSTKVLKSSENSMFYVTAYSSGTVEVLNESLESVYVTELDDSLGIASRLEVLQGKDQVFAGTSGSYVLSFEMDKLGKLEQTRSVKLADRSGVTSISFLHPNIVVGCDSGHVYKLNGADVAKVHSHLSTVVGIVASQGFISSVSLDCAILKSSETAPEISRKPTIISMPGGIVKTGDSRLVVFGDGIQVIDNFC